jgi:hypothetical protein
MKVRVTINHQLGGGMVALRGDVLDLDEAKAMQKVAGKLAQHCDQKAKTTPPRTAASVANKKSIHATPEEDAQALESAASE